MFTGLVRERGRLSADPAPSRDGGVRLEIAHSPDLAATLETGASLAVSGVCLTVVDRLPAGSAFELGAETLRRTTLGALGAGDAVNLEPALCAGDALGGHWVQGHVDATVVALARRDLAAHRELTFALPPHLASMVVEKGSVTLDGVSLTVAALPAGSFTVALIPHTLERTTLGSLESGDRVNLEIDILAKYVSRAIEPWRPPVSP